MTHLFKNVSCRVATPVKGPSYVCRLRDNTVAEVFENKSLIEADRVANVLSDQIVRFGKSGNKATD